MSYFSADFHETRDEVGFAIVRKHDLGGVVYYTSGSGWADFTQSRVMAHVFARGTIRKDSHELILDADQVPPRETWELIGFVWSSMKRASEILQTSA